MGVGCCIGVLQEESFGNREQGGVESLPVSLDRRVYMYMDEYLAIIR